VQGITFPYLHRQIPFFEIHSLDVKVAAVVKKSAKDSQVKRTVEGLSRGEFVFLRETSTTPVPTVGTWGSVVMVLLVLTAGSVVLRREHSAL
jgi:hypothetical protein